MSLDKMNKLFVNIKTNFISLVDSELRSFNTIKNLPDKSGVYMIFEKGNVIYVGSTDNLKRRLNYLFSSNPEIHTLSKKLRKKFKWSKQELQDFYMNSCMFKFHVVNDIFEVVEHFAITFFNPKYND